MITPQQAGQTVKTLLRQSYQMSNTQLKRLKQQPGGLLCNGAPVFVTAVLSAGDRLHVSLEDTAGPCVTPCRLALDICWEDDFLLVVNKPAAASLFQLPAGTKVQDMDKMMGGATNDDDEEEEEDEEEDEGDEEGQQEIPAEVQKLMKGLF